MAGTDSTRTPVTGGPAIVLVAPQLGENIGAAARAMLNCGLVDLRLVRPRDGWPNPAAEAAASGAGDVLARARLYEATAEAIADLEVVIAATARRRDMVKPVLTPRAAAARLRQEEAAGRRTGVLFGPERTGLTNDDVALADAVLQVPLNPAFASLNLAQAVLLIGYAWFEAADGTTGESLPMAETRPATKAELMGLFRQLEAGLDAGGFLYPPEKRPSMVRNIRNMITRAGWTEQEVRTFRGIITALIRAGRAPRDPGGD